MDQPFQPFTLSVRKAFSDSDSLYQIPRYQRPYKWEDEHVERLWDDIKEAADNSPESNYFLGSIVTATPPERTRYKDVVDGQQRLTTLMILFCVIKNAFPGTGAKSDDDLAVRLDDVVSAICIPGDRDRLKLFPHANAQSDFHRCIIAAEKAELGCAKPSPKEMKTGLPKFKFMNAAFILRREFDKLNDEERQKFVNFLFNQVQIIRIDCKDVNIAIKLFQVINDRGMDLSSSDLIKSFLLGKIGDDPDSKKLEESFGADWQDVERSIAECDISADDMFTLYEYYALASNPKKSLYEHMQEIFKSSKKDPVRFLGEIKKFSGNYVSKIHRAKNRDINALKYLPWTMHWKSILLAGLQGDRSDLSELAGMLRRFYYLYWVGGKTLSRVKQTSFNIIRAVKKGSSVQAIESDVLMPQMDRDRIVSAAKDALESDNIAGEKWCKPLLMLIEQNDDADAPEFRELSNSIHLEHVLPVAHKGKWGGVGEDVADRYLNSGGNLTLLAGKKNIVGQNKPFAEKVEIYRGKGGENVTAFRITRQIAEDYETNAYAKQWGEATMRDRKAWFVREASKIIGINLDSD